MKINSKIKDDLKKYMLEKMRKDQQKVVVFSGASLSNDEIKILKNRFPHFSWSDASFKVDESLIAGVIIAVGSKVIDLSLKGSLSNLKQIIYETD